MRLTILLISLVISSSALPGSGQRPLYLETLPTFWRELYPAGGQGLYCGQDFGRRDRRYNVEHVFPMAWVTRELRCGSRAQCRRNSPRFNRIEADMHNLFPARKDINKRRGAMAYAEIEGERWVEKGCDLEVDKRRRRVEPRPAVRGEIARAMLYMSERYQLELYPRQRKLLLRWHRDDPPLAAEKRRARRIERLQGNHNSWIGR